MKTITFNTGRGYSAEGQIIVAEEHGELLPIDEWLDGAEQQEQYIIFEDKTRGIKGRIDFCELTEKSIMKNYDEKNYQDY